MGQAVPVDDVKKLLEGLARARSRRSSYGPEYGVDTGPVALVDEVLELVTEIASRGSPRCLSSHTGTVAAPCGQADLGERSTARRRLSRDGTLAATTGGLSGAAASGGAQVSDREPTRSNSLVASPGDSRFLDTLARRFYAVMFTDIKDSTGYYTRAGDVAGRLKVRRHDELLYPIVAEHAGQVVNHTGDGLLGAFDEPNDCCRAAVVMQQALARHNEEVGDKEDELHVRVAAHAGVGLRDPANVFGQIVNAAARIQLVADPDQIVISGALYAHLGEGLQQRCSFLQERELRGTGQVHRLYELAWSAGEPLLPQSWGAEPWLPTSSSAPIRVDRLRAQPVTALCVDIEQSSALRDRLAGAMPAVLRRYEEIVGACVERFGGNSQGVAGDTVRATFGDAGLACHAAVEVQRALTTEDWSLSAGGLDTLRARITIHSAVEGESDQEVIERAARLSSAGHGGQILLTADAYGALRDRLPESLEIRAYGNRVLQDHRYSESIVELVVPDLPATDPVLRTSPERAPSHRIRFGARADERPAAQVLESVLAAVRADGGVVTVSDQEARALAREKPADLERYRVSRVIEWSQPRYQLDSRFVQLSLLVDKGEAAEGERWRVSERPIEDVRDLLVEIDEPAAVVLGPPGAGKSTILRRLELDASLAGLRSGAETAVVPFFVPLNQYRPEQDGEFPAPGDWLRELWATRYPALPSLAALEQQSRVLYLLDGLNEMPTSGEADFRRCIRLWKRFVEGSLDRASGNRFVFSCRSLDYSAPLSSPGLRVPQVRVEPMTDRQVRQYLKLYSPSHWVDIWEEISGSNQLDLFRSPFFLKLLVDQVETQGQIPKGRAGLFTGFVRQAVRRELERDNPLFDDEALIAARDRRRIVAWQWTDPYALPARGALVPLLERLAYAMQQSDAGTEASQVRVHLDVALDIIDHDRGEAVLMAGAALSILDESSAEEVLFTHQLVQEYFAARRLATGLDVELVRLPWRALEVRPSLPEVVASLAPADPLPPLPGTGWEETTLLAAAMAPEPDRFIRTVADVNLVLSGRCAAQPELGDRLAPELTTELRRRLAARSRDAHADLRARIAAGLTLGRLGGPPFEPRIGPRGPYLLPPVVEIEGGPYVIGSDTPYRDRGHPHHEETPTCTVTLEPFAIGKFAVTNGEWSYFMAGGGYDDERFWDGDEARAWYHGEGTVVNVRNMARFWRKRFLEDPELVQREYESDRMEPSTYELWNRRLNMDDEEFEHHLAESFPAGRLREPRFWRTPRFNNPMQPVIGISCFEARAYTRWLAEQSGLPFRLLTEAEWEVAARGREGRRFAYGNTFDPLRGNTVETHVRAPTPVGVFPEGDTPEGVADMTGNTYDLTASLWGDDPNETSWPYPYDPRDGREEHDVPVTVSRVGRGGAWYLGEVHARASYRGRDRYELRPDDWLNYRGCRVALARS